MDKSYRFLSDTEPTDEQLQSLMRAVTQDVRQRAKKNEERHRALMLFQLEETLKQWQLIHPDNGGE